LPNKVWHSESMNTSLTKPPLKVINLFGAPGVGKSTIAAGLFYFMKMSGMSVEHVTEYAKYLVLTKRVKQLEDEQLYLLAKQHHKQHILRGQYEWAITDSPLLLCAYYAPKETTPEPFWDMVQAYNDTFDNYNVFLTRGLEKDDTSFEAQGRLQNKEEAYRIQQLQMEFLEQRNIPFDVIEIQGEDTARVLMRTVMEEDEKRKVGIE
jgi:AAA domain